MERTVIGRERVDGENDEEVVCWRREEEDEDGGDGQRVYL